MSQSSVRVGQLTFILDHWRDNQTGDKRTQTVLVHGRIAPRISGVSRGATPDPVSGPIKTNQRLRQLACDKGHIVGLELGGPDTGVNVVPMLSYFNRIGPWRSLERELFQDAKNCPYVAISIIYYPDLWMLPWCFRVASSETAIQQPPPSALEVFMRPEPAKPYNPRLDEPSAPWLNRYHDEFLNNEQDMDFSVFDEESPYRQLDELNRKTNFFRINEGVATRFLPGQKLWIKMFNSRFTKSKDGFLRSDVRDDPYDILNCRGGDDYPNVDHIIPFSMGGDNRFSNARLVSAKYNADKRATVTPEQREAVLKDAEQYRKAKLRSGNPLKSMQPKVEAMREASRSAILDQRLEEQSARREADLTTRRRNTQ